MLAQLNQRKFHPYEGYDLLTVVHPIRFLALLGVKDIICMAFTLCLLVRWNLDRPLRSN